MLDQVLANVISRLLDLASIPIFLLSYLVPRNDDLHAYGYGNGRSFTDNSKFQYLHAFDNEPAVRSVWLTKNDDVLRELRQEGYDAFHFRSFGGSLITLRAGTVFVTHSRRDVPWYLTGGAEVVRLGHGIPFKKYGRADPGYAERKGTLQRIGYERTVAKYASTIATSERFVRYVAEATGLDERDVHVTGLPRMDMPHVADEARELYCDADVLRMLRTELSDSTVVFYFPTWRDGDASPVPDDLDLVALDETLAATDSYLLTRPHTNSGDLGLDATELERVIALDADSDFYPVFDEVDLFVTDYSSLFHDSVYYETPVLFFAHDLSTYSDVREFFFEYESVPGDVLTSSAEFQERIRDVLEDVEAYERRYEDELEEWRERTFDYRDDDNCERVFRTFSASGPGAD